METTQCFDPKTIRNIIFTSVDKIKSVTSRKSYWERRNILPMWEHIHSTTKHLDPTASWKERIYCLINDIHHYSLCSVCGSHNTFQSTRIGYSKTCSRKCNNKSPERGDKIKNAFANMTVLEKKNHAEVIRKGFRRKYGVDNVFQTETFKENLKINMTEKYGVDNYFKRGDLVREDWSRTLGCDNPRRNKEIQDKSLKTVKERYPNLLGCVPREAAESTNMKRYGNKNFFGSEKGNMSYSSLKNNYGWSNADLVGLSKQKRSGVAFGKASMESLLVFIPIYKYLRRLGISRKDIEFGIDGSKELNLSDTKNNKFYYYDFTILSKKIIIEFNGVAFHTKSPLDENWKCPFNGITPKDQFEKDQQKLDFAKKNGYTVLVLWSDAGTKTNLDISKMFINKELQLCN